MANTVAYHPEFARLLDAGGKPVGTDAALLLSQAVWLTKERSDGQGWFEWTARQCEEQTGLTVKQQEYLFPRLEAAGYLVRSKSRKGSENGLRRVRLCADTLKFGNRIPRNSGTETENEKGSPEIREPKKPDTLKFGNRIPRNSGTETPSLFNQETKTPEETSPPNISPPKVGKVAFLPPTSEEAHAFIVTEIGGSLADAENFFDHFSANGWLVSGRTKMKDWKAAARKWVRQSAQWEAERQTRAGPGVRNGHGPPVKTPEERSKANRDFLERVAKEKGFNYG